MKTMKDVLAKMKGEGNTSKVLTGKGNFSSSLYKEMVHGMVNDTTYEVGTFGKDGKKTYKNISDLIRADAKKLVQKAGYPQKSELDKLNTVEIPSEGIAEAVKYVVREYIETGRKFELPPTEQMVGSIYLAPVKGREKIIKVRDMNTKEDRGTATITTQDSIQLRAKSPVPKHLQTKVRKDPSGNIIKKQN
jgi:hypothetical protein